MLLPYSYAMMQNPRYAAEFEALLALCQARGVAVQTIKSICRAPWNGRAQTHATWYEPFTVQADIDAAIDWVLSRPGLFLNTAGDLSILPKVLDAASRFEPASADPAALSAQVAAQAAQPLFTA